MDQDIFDTNSILRKKDHIEKDRAESIGCRNLQPVGVQI
jgi:hypothetical protein